MKPLRSHLKFFKFNWVERIRSTSAFYHYLLSQVDGNVKQEEYASVSYKFTFLSSELYSSAHAAILLVCKPAVPCYLNPTSIVPIP